MKFFNFFLLAILRPLVEYYSPDFLKNFLNELMQK